MLASNMSRAQDSKNKGSSARRYAKDAYEMVVPLKNQIPGHGHLLQPGCAGSAVGSSFASTLSVQKATSCSQGRGV